MRGWGRGECVWILYNCIQAVLCVSTCLNTRTNFTETHACVYSYMCEISWNEFVELVVGIRHLCVFRHIFANAFLLRKSTSRSVCAQSCSETVSQRGCWDSWLRGGRCRQWFTSDSNPAIDFVFLFQHPLLTVNPPSSFSFLLRDGEGSSFNELVSGFSLLPKNTFTVGIAPKWLIWRF